MAQPQHLLSERFVASCCADGNNLLCGLAGSGKTVVDRSNEKKATRADIVAGLKASYAACDKVFAETTEANASTPVDFFGQKDTRLGVLAFTNSHISHDLSRHPRRGSAVLLAPSASTTYPPVPIGRPGRWPSGVRTCLHEPDKKRCQREPCSVSASPS